MPFLAMILYAMSSIHASIRAWEDMGRSDAENDKNGGS